MFIQMLWKRPDMYVCWVVMVIFSVCIHELSHVYAALSQGDDTAAKQGYVTLDPLKLMGRSSLVALAFIGIAWGKVPVTLSKFRHWYSHALVSAAGPGANLLLAVLFSLATALTYRFATSPELLKTFATFFKMGVTLNCLLAILNLLPIPMFDGWEVAALIAPRLNRIPPESRQQGGWIALMIIFFSPAQELLWMGADGLTEAMLRAASIVLPVTN